MQAIVVFLIQPVLSFFLFTSSEKSNNFNVLSTGPTSLPAGDFDNPVIYHPLAGYVNPLPVVPEEGEEEEEDIEHLMDPGAGGDVSICL